METLRNEVSIVALFLIALSLVSCGGLPAGHNDARQNIIAAYQKLKTSYPYRISETVDFKPRNQEPSWKIDRLLKVPSPAQMDVKGSGKTWIAIADGLPQQADSELKVSSATSKTHAVYEYHVNVTIERPVP